MVIQDPLVPADHEEMEGLLEAEATAVAKQGGVFGDANNGNIGSPDGNVNSFGNGGNGGNYQPLP